MSPRLREAGRKKQAMKKQSGFTLIEFIVSMGITLLVMATALETFRDAIKTSDRVSQMSEMSDNLRAGLNLMVQDMIQAGSGVPTGGIPIPNTSNGATPACNTGFTPKRPSPTAGTFFPACNFVLAAIEPGSNMGPQITSPDTLPGVQTDIITFLYADPADDFNNVQINSAACPGTISANGDTATFSTNAGCVNFSTTDFNVSPGDLILFSNAKGMAIQTVTSLTNSGQVLKFVTGDAFGFNQSGQPNGTMIQMQSSPGVYPQTSATRIWMISYYLDNTTVPNNVRLVRQVNFNPAQPVGETLENLQFTYNFVDGVTNPSNQASIPAGLSENQIRAVNILLGVRSPVASFLNNSRRYLRSNLQTQVSLRSMAYVNQYK